MTDTDQEKKEEVVLKRMLKTPPKPHKEKKGGKPKPTPSRIKRSAGSQEV